MEMMTFGKGLTDAKGRGAVNVWGKSILDKRASAKAPRQECV